MKAILRVIVFAAVFAAGVIFFSGFLKKGTTARASDLDDPTLPVLCIDVDGNKADRMFGYRTMMDGAALRDALIPVSTDHTVRLSYKDNASGVSSVSYEITAPDTGEVIENAKVGNFLEDGEYRSASFTLTTPILMNREYPVRFTLSTESGPVYFYARLIQRSNPQTALYVKFVADFCETCLNKGAAGSLSTYLETDETITNNSFHEVNIKSTLDKVSWGNLSAQLLRKGIPTIREINDNTASLTNEYLISAQNESGQRELYRVNDFYRLRYYNGRMMLLNFERKCDQVYTPALLMSSSISTNGVELGVASKDVPYMADETGRVVAFVQDNTLWSFNTSSQKLVRVFSVHRDDESGDERYDHNDYGIRLTRVRSSGDIDFVVYGYMNRGRYEGLQGVQVMTFSGEGGFVEERAFLPCEGSKDLLENMLNRLSYISTGGQYYVYLNRSVYRIDLATVSPSVILSDIHPDCFTAAADGSAIAWMDGMDPDGTAKIEVRDLEKEASREIAAEDGTLLKTIGFINRDLIYGIADESDLVTLPQGNELFAMRTLMIEDTEGNRIKEYHRDGYWVSDVSFLQGLIELDCVTKREDGSYEDAGTDNIMNNRQTSGPNITVTTTNNSRRGTLVTIKLPNTVRNLSPAVEEARVRARSGEGKVNLHIQYDRSFPIYYVYAYGGLREITTSPSEAVRLADEMVGVVLNEEGQYVYERGNSGTEYEIMNEDLLAEFIAPTINAAELQQHVGDSARVIDLSGCTLTQVLYEVSRGRAVLARTAEGDVAMIVGFNRYNTRLYNFETGEHFWYGINDSTALFEGGGNLFISYIEPDKTVKGAE